MGDTKGLFGRDEYTRRQYKIAKAILKHHDGYLAAYSQSGSLDIIFLGVLWMEAGLEGKELISDAFQYEYQEVLYHIEQLKNQGYLASSSLIAGGYSVTSAGKRWIVEGIEVEEAKPSKQESSTKLLNMKKLYEALLVSHSTRPSLERMLLFELDENLNAIAGTDLSQKDTVFKVITWAKQYGRLDVLIRGAYMDNPSNPELKAFVEEYFGELPEGEGDE